jgi:hypothetical protein
MSSKSHFFITGWLHTPQNKKQSNHNIVHFIHYWQEHVRSLHYNFQADSTPRKPNSQLIHILKNMPDVGYQTIQSSHNISLSDSIYNCSILIRTSSMQPWREMAETMANRRRRQQRGGRQDAVAPRRARTRWRCTRMDATPQHRGQTCRRTVGGTDTVPLQRAPARRGDERGGGSECTVSATQQRARTKLGVWSQRGNSARAMYGASPYANFAKKPSQGCIFSLKFGQSSQTYTRSALNVGKRPRWPYWPSKLYLVTVTYTFRTTVTILKIQDRFSDHTCILLQKN